MKKTKTELDYKFVILHILLTFSFIMFSKLEKDVFPYSIAVYAAAMYVGASPLLSPFLFIGSFLFTGSYGLLLTAAVSSLFLSMVTVINKKYRSLNLFSISLSALIASFIYAVVGDTSVYVPIFKRFFVLAVILTLTVALSVSLRAIKEKGVQAKYGYEEYLFITACFIVFGIGICNAISPFVYYALSIFIIISISYFCGFGAGTVISASLGITLFIFYKNLNYISLYLCFGLASVAFSPFIREFSVGAILLIYYLCSSVFHVFGDFSIIEFISLLIGGASFCLIPKKTLSSIKERLYFLSERQLIRHTINRNRKIISNRLYELAGVFDEMAGAFSDLKKATISDEKISYTVSEEVIRSVCEKCENREKCKIKSGKIFSELKKLTGIGIAKGKVNLIDFSKDLSACCIHASDILFYENKLLASYRLKRTEQENYSIGRDIIAAQSKGVSEILKNLGFDTGKTLKYRYSAEKTLYERLFKNGFNVIELMVFGENDGISITLLLSMKEFSLDLLCEVLSKAVGFKLAVFENVTVAENLFCLSFRKSAEYDAVFGLATVKKDNSDMSGDTHSVTRIKEDKFLIALSDGMGSGKDAEKVSSCSLSLIESFYKAGLSDSLILSTVNKLLAVNTEDTFSALDLSIVNLKNCSADFIKYGSPYGFIIGEDGIKIVEGNSLPLGILDELKPSVCHAQLKDGDMLLFLTDGISDSFGSSSEVIEYLKTVPALNPQSLADGILKKAVSVNGGVKKDDMTALAVRIFKKDVV